jgi:antirestriction protein ArdC
MVDVNQIVTDRICELLEKGVVPWRRPWTGCFPTNYDSGKEYQGINTLMLGGAAMVSNYKSPYWLTYRQAQKHGGNVKQGEHGSIIVWKESGLKEVKHDDGTKALKKFFYLKYYTVFNLEQCQGVPEKSIVQLKEADMDKGVIERCEALISNMPTPPTIVTGQIAAYNPARDTLILPSMEYFESLEAHYACKYHELTHSTGHQSRLARPGVTDYNQFGSHKYSFEELVAEMGSAYLCARAGIDCPAVVENSAAYVASWLRTLKADKTVLLKAAGKSSAAVEYILSGKVPVQTCQAAPMVTA